MDFLPKLLTLPVLFLAVLGSFLAIVKKSRVGISLILWSLLPNLIFISLIKSFTTRYILFTIPPLLILAAWGLDELLAKVKNIKVIIILILITITPALFFDLILLTNPQAAPLPQESHEGYFSAWTAGYGLKETSQLLTQPRNPKVVVGVNSTFGVFPEGLEIYLGNNPNVILLTGLTDPNKDLLTWAKQYPTYFLSDNLIYVGGGSHLELLREYPKASGKGPIQDKLLLYRVIK